MKKIKAILILLLLCLGFVPAFAHADTHYVSPEGFAAWVNSVDILQPCSWTTAMANATAGDVVYFRGGTYDLGTFANRPSMGYVKMHPANSGIGDSDNQRIIFKAYPNETPNITGSVSSVSQECWFGCGNGNSYVTWDGFHATAQVNESNYETAIFAAYGTSCRLMNSVFTGVDVGSRQYNSSFVRIEGANNAIIENNDFQGLSGAAVNTAAVWIFASTDSHIRNNTIRNCSNGVMQKTGPNRGNRIYRNYINTLDYDGVFLNEQTSTGEDCSIYQNIIVNPYNGSSFGGIRIAGVSSINTTNNYKIYNNTLYGSGLGISTSTNTRNAQIWNNVIHSAGAPFVRYYSGVALPAYSDYNCFYDAGGVWNLDWSTNHASISDWQTTTGLDTHSVMSDPGLVKPGGTNPSDYKRSFYPANGRGGLFASVMGAYITGSEVIGYVPVKGPVDPLSTILFQEDFDDANFGSRGWYDNTKVQVSTNSHIPGSTGSAEFHFLQGVSTPTSGGAMRRKFSESEAVYVSYFVKYSSNWTGSNKPYHPHEFLILTNQNADWDGLSDNHLTAYIEQNEGTPLLALQDGQNIDETMVDHNLVNVTEIRSVAGCNGDSDGHGDGDCYLSGSSHRNGKSWRASGVYFQDAVGSYYKNDWHFVEIYFKMNRILSGKGIPDGILKYWYDGQIIIDHDNVMFRTGQYPNMRFNQFIIAPWIGDGSPIDQTFWVDNLTVATSRPFRQLTPPSNLGIVQNGGS